MIVFWHYLIIPAQPSSHLIIVPGLNGQGGENVDIVLPYFSQKPTLKHLVGTPDIIIDFGQGRCQKYLDATVNSLGDTKKIIHASSQGTATAINYTAKHPGQISALILESIMLSGNHAIEYNLPIPRCYHILPYLAKIIYPFYAPAGEQPILNANELPINIPIIILHDENDFQLSYKGAKALYAFLKNKNPNVYLMTKKSLDGEHISLLTWSEDTTNDTNQNKIDAINAILQNHKLLPLKENTPIDMAQIASSYQPEINSADLEYFYEIHAKEQNFWYVDWAVKIMFSGLILMVLYNKGIINNMLNGIGINFFNNCGLFHIRILT